MADGKRGSDQAYSFEQAARELGCDESEAAFEDKLRKIAKAKPKSTDSDTKAKAE